MHTTFTRQNDKLWCYIVTCSKSSAENYKELPLQFIYTTTLICSTSEVTAIQHQRHFD